MKSQEIRLKVIMWLLLHEANKLRNHILKEAFDWVDNKIPLSKEEQAQRRHATTDSKGKSIYNQKKKKNLLIFISFFFLKSLLCLLFQSSINFAMSWFVCLSICFFIRML